MPDTVGGVPVYRDSAGVLREQAGQAQIDQLAAQVAGKADASAVAAVSDVIASKADASAIPKPANTAPLAEKTGATTGSATTRFALEDHQHPRLTSTTVASIAAGNTANIAFTRAFANEPGIDYQELPPTPTTTTPIPADTSGTAQPTQSKVIAWLMGPSPLLPNAGANEYTGCTVRVFKAQTVPQNLVSLLLGAVFNIFGASVVGTRFSIIAVARSDV